VRKLYREQMLSISLYTAFAVLTSPFFSIVSLISGVAKLWKLRLVDNKKGGSAILTVRPWRVFHGHCISGRVGAHTDTSHGSSSSNNAHSRGGVQTGAVSSELGVCVICSGGVALSYALRGHSGVLRRFHVSPLEPAGRETTEKANEKASLTDPHGTESSAASTADELPPPPPPPLNSPASSPSSSSMGAPPTDSKIWQVALSSSLGLLAFYFTTTTTTTTASSSSAGHASAASSGPEVRHWLQVHSINGGCSGNSSCASISSNTNSSSLDEVPCLAEMELAYACTSLNFVGSGAVLSVTTRNGRLELLRATDLRPLSAVNLLDPNAAPTAAASAAAATNTTAGNNSASFDKGAAERAAVPPPAPPSRFEVVLSMGGVPVECASSVDWAPDPSRPALLAWGDGTGAVSVTQGS